MNVIIKFAKIMVLAAALAWVPEQLLAQSANSTNGPASPQKAGAGNARIVAGEKKPTAGPFHGKLKAVDKAAKTITVGKRTFWITSQTRLNKGGQPATLNDAVVGEPVSGYVKPNEKGKLAATVVNFGPKPGSKPKKKTVPEE